MAFEFCIHPENQTYTFQDGRTLLPGDIVTIAKIGAGMIGMGSQPIERNVELYYCGLAGVYSNGEAFLLCGTPDLGSFGIESTEILSITKPKKLGELMNTKRYEEIIWERNNDRAKFNLHAAEYFEEMMPLLEQLLDNKSYVCPTEDKKANRKRKPNESR